MWRFIEDLASQLKHVLFVAVGVTNAGATNPPETTWTSAEETTVSATNSTTERYQLCPDFECPNSDDEGGLFSVYS